MHGELEYRPIARANFEGLHVMLDVKDITASIHELNKVPTTWKLEVRFGPAFTKKMRTGRSTFISIG